MTLKKEQTKGVELFPFPCNSKHLCVHSAQASTLQYISTPCQPNSLSTATTLFSAVTEKKRRNPVKKKVSESKGEEKNKIILKRLLNSEVH